MTDTSKPGYDSLQAMIEHLTQALGGNHFCRVVLVKVAADLVRDLVNRRLGGYDKIRGMLPGQLLLATDGELHAVADTLERMITVERPEAPSMASQPVHGAVLALKGSSLLFQTDAASICLAHAYRNTNESTHKTPWTATLTDAGDIFVMHIDGAESPDRGMVHTKSEQSARESLVRFAEKAFRIPMAAQATNTEMST
jgi:hypothetical protein